MNKTSWNVALSPTVSSPFHILFEESDMRFVSLLAVPLLMATVSPALAKGCLRGAAAGAVGGHFVGKGHAVIGAAAGCVVAHHHYAKQARAEKAAAKQHR